MSHTNYKNNLLYFCNRSFQKLQDILGAIHDYDFTIEFLSTLRQPSLEIQEITSIEKEERSIKFDEFLRFSKSRLDISPQSFLMAVRKLY